MSGRLGGRGCAAGVGAGGWADQGGPEGPLCPQLVEAHRPFQKGLPMCLPGGAEGPDPSPGLNPAPTVTPTWREAETQPEMFQQKKRHDGSWQTFLARTFPAGLQANPWHSPFLGPSLPGPPGLALPKPPPSPSRDRAAVSTLRPRTHLFPRDWVWGSVPIVMTFSGVGRGRREWGLAREGWSFP